MKSYSKLIAGVLIGVSAAASLSVFAGRNGSGTYSLPAGNPVTTSTTISSTWANNTLSDIRDALTASVAKDGQTAMTGNLSLGGNRITNLGSASADTDAISRTYADSRYLGVLSATLPANGIYLPSANTLGFATNTTARGTINSTGNWVINAPSTGVALTVSGAGTSAPLTLSAPSTYNAFNATDGTVNSIFGFGGGRNNLYVTSAHALALGTNNTERVVLGSAGNVTVNAPSSGTTLALTSVAGTSVPLSVSNGTVNGQLDFSGTTSFEVGTTSAHALNLFTNNSTRIAINSAGNVTLNTPSSGTHVINGAAAATAVQIVHGATNVGLQLSNGSGQLDFQASGGTSVINTPGAWGLALQTNSVSRLTINSAGAATFSGNLTVSGTTTLSSALGVASGGTGVTSSTGSGSVVLSASPALTGTPTAPTAATGTQTTQIATTAFVNPASSIGANGYQKFSSGLILQWGTVSVGDVSGMTSGSVTFPLACPTAVFTVTASFRDDNNLGSNVGRAIVYTNGHSTTGFSYGFAENTAGTEAGTLNWQATCN